jgi:hypothetical protein
MNYDERVSDSLKAFKAFCKVTNLDEFKRFLALEHLYTVDCLEQLINGARDQVAIKSRLYFQASAVFAICISTALGAFVFLFGQVLPVHLSAHGHGVWHFVRSLTEFLAWIAVVPGAILILIYKLGLLNREEYYLRTLTDIRLSLLKNRPLFRS